jgi:hypothetical protein
MYLNLTTVISVGGLGHSLVEHANQKDEDAHLKGTQVATENLFRDFPGHFPAAAGFPLRFLESETSHTSVVLTLCTFLSSIIHPFTRAYIF